ncbi:hypothetical protein FNU76_01140 [Chitinimonas arctica]|uniref:Uncharacterized protein n=1 Tax=Chitinimonas arctica TaxID=2594795 RepID=A0A516SA84_9NEIS|nr:hypothetical protein [Chitinimonas arctica]QDQ25065.1 hypothetical protein FNU76_01140 [Chitinimonas arctica]
MLNQLLYVKRRREQGMRSALTMIARQEAALEEEEARLVQERLQLWEEWNSGSAAQGVVTQTQFQTIKGELAMCYQRDRVIGDRIEALHAEAGRLKVAKAEQLSLLRKNLLEQEKLLYLLEQSDEHISS